MMEPWLKRGAVPLSMALALAIGLTHVYVLVVAWSYIGVHTPLPAWLFKLGFRGTAFSGTVLAADWLTTVLLSIPAAFVLVHLRPARTWWYVAAAVLSSFAWSNHFAWLNGGIWPVRDIGRLVLRWIPELFSLPLATWLLLAWGAPGAPRRPVAPAAV